MKRRLPEGIEHLVQFEILSGDKWLPIPARLIYRPADPLAVQLRFSQAGREVDWLVARELLSTGCHIPAGIGDCKVAPSTEYPGRTTISLSSPDGIGYLRTQTAPLMEFLSDTFALIPGGTERVDVDALLVAAGVA